jgi:CRISPR/Cas system-associated exonuclease Cas4 (RecB family)
MKKNVKRPATGFPSLPSGIDRVIKEHFNKHLKNNTVPKELSKININVKLFSNELLLKRFMNNISWTNEQGHVLQGKIDYLLEDEQGKAVLIDFKTKGSELNERDDKGIREHYSQQLNIYAFLLIKNNMEIRDKGYLLYFYPKQLKENGDFEFGSEAKEIKLDPLSAEQLFYEAVEILKMDKPPSSSDNCEFCKWASARDKKLKELDVL